MLDYYQRFITGSKELFEALSKEKGLEQIIAIGYKMLENPITLQDTSRKILAITRFPEIEDDPAWHEFSTEGYSSQRTMYHSLESGLERKVSLSSEPFIWEINDYVKYRRIMSRITYGNKTIGILSIVEGKRKFNDGDIELTALLSNALSTEMQKNTFLLSTLGYGYEVFIKELLDGNFKDKKFVHSRTEYINLHLKKKIYVVVIDIRELDKTLIVPSHLRKSLESMIIESRTLVYNENVVLVLSCDNEKRFLDHGLLELENYLKQYNLKCGISNVFLDLSDIQEYFIQAVDSLKLGKLINPQNTAYKYEEYIFYNFIDICSQYMEPKKLIHPSILRLIDYDKQNHTNLYDSLSMYFKNSRNIPLTAKSFNIHRNTMFYRMDKIKEVINVDLNDNLILLHLELSFKFLEYEKSKGN